MPCIRWHTSSYAGHVLRRSFYGNALILEGNSNERNHMDDGEGFKIDILWTIKTIYEVHGRMCMEKVDTPSFLLRRWHK